MNSEAIAIAERFADGAASQHELFKVFLELERHADTRDSPARFAAEDRIAQRVKTCADFAIYSVEDDGVDSDKERAEQASLLRCICGNFYRPATIDPVWLTWHDGLLVSMARKMYDSRDFTDMPVLADALEEAGCTNQDILNHCRQSGVHVRGCWVVDLLVGRK
jgi:hypothetical protein